LARGAAALAGAGRRQRVQGGVLAQPGGPGHRGRQLLQLAPGVGRIGHDVDVAAGQGAGQRFSHAAGRPQPGGGVCVLDDQLGQHRDRDRPAPSPLTARITAGRTAQAGTDFGYLVTLTNPTAKPFPLPPCPSYAESLGGLMGSGAPKSHVVRYYYLNCTTVEAIPAHGSVTYQMKLPLPSGLPAGFYSKLDWQIQGGTGPAVATSLTVEPLPSRHR
jgi:hypothetical protein